MDFHNYMNKEITFARSNDIMMYARGKHTQFNNDRRGHPEIWKHDQCLNDDSISNRLRVKLSTINFKAIWLLEVQNPSSTIHLLVSRLESTREPRKNGDGEKYHDTKNS